MEILILVVVAVVIGGLIYVYHNRQKIDTNQDGKIDVQEVKAAAKVVKQEVKAATAKTTSKVRSAVAKKTKK